MDTQHFKALLEKEKENLETELGTIGTKNPNHPYEWQLNPNPEGRDRADETEVADDLENLQNNQSLLTQLEIQLNDVITALGKIDADKYGICEVCGKEIGKDRLEANPSAKTCELHMNS